MRAASGEQFWQERERESEVKEFPPIFFGQRRCRMLDAAGFGRNVEGGSIVDTLLGDLEIQ